MIQRFKGHNGSILIDERYSYIGRSISTFDGLQYVNGVPPQTIDRMNLDLLDVPGFGVGQQAPRVLPVFKGGHAGDFILVHLPFQLAGNILLKRRDADVGDFLYLIGIIGIDCIGIRVLYLKQQ